MGAVGRGLAVLLEGATGASNRVTDEVSRRPERVGQLRRAMFRTRTLHTHEATAPTRQRHWLRMRWAAVVVRVVLPLGIVG